ncbi:MAG: glycosyltransferase family 2 protein [Polyangiaceae bacterium]|nr:glycosyltransferase family 2 protein [Polyangiaceae bacterium]
MKLIIQIPCFNEAATLAITLAALPKRIEGIDTIEVLVINDGSTDDTVAVAKNNGVHHVVGFTRNQGLAKAFMLGLRSAVALGADIIVNTDADNQYCADDIAALVQPVMEGRADIVIGARPISAIEHFSLTKKLLQKLGSWFVRTMSNTDVVDAPSGFRAISRQAACTLNVFNNYTYTLETIIQAGQKNLQILSVPVRVNGDLRPSRLVRSIPAYIRKSIVTVFRIIVVYRPFRFFAIVGLLFFLSGLGVGIRFLYYYFQNDGAGRVQSLILASVLLMMSVQIGMMGFIADLLSVNRRLLEDLEARERSKSQRKPREL